MSGKGRHLAQKKKREAFNKKHSEGRKEYSRLRRKAILDKAMESWHTPPQERWIVRQKKKVRKAKVSA